MPILRNASPACIAALGSGVPLKQANFFEFDLADGVTSLFFTDWTSNLVADGHSYLSQPTLVNKGKWNLVNTMTVPSLEVVVMAGNSGFNGGAQVKTQIHNGLFAGAKFLLTRAYMTLPDAKTGNTSTLGTVAIFAGIVGAIDLIGTTATITVKGKNNRLNQYGPRATFQQPCNHTFCDVGCGASRTNFTFPYIVGASPTPTSTFVPWTVPPASPLVYTGGTFLLTSGSGDSQQRGIVMADSTGVYLIYPLTNVPSPGDAFTGFQGCDKTFNSGSGQSCTDYGHQPSYDGFEFSPPANTGF